MLPEAGCGPGTLRLAWHAAIALSCLALSGCYLTHVSTGHMKLMEARQPIVEVLARPGTSPRTRERLEYVLAARRFAAEQLGLPDNGSFTSFVELRRPYVAWNVFAAAEFSVEPRRWCFPVSGCVAYRGYFSKDKAQDYARRILGQGYDVHVAPVAAYSTLGHFDDPVLSTMLSYGDAELAGLIFHELAHQVVYVPGDSDFNEAFATAVEIEGVGRWLGGLGREGELAAWRQSRERLFAITDLMAGTRARLAELYASGLNPAAMREGKQLEFGRLRAAYESLRAGWSDGVNLDRTLPADLNNARLASVSIYHHCLPGFTALLEGLDRDLEEFYRAVRRMGRQAASERQATVCGGLSATGAAAEAGVGAAPALEPEVARDDRLQSTRLDAEAGEAVPRADAVDGE
jgi:predicted aminopeptidase